MEIEEKLLSWREQPKQRPDYLNKFLNKYSKDIKDTGSIKSFLDYLSENDFNKACNRVMSILDGSNPIAIAEVMFAKEYFVKNIKGNMIYLNGIIKRFSIPYEGVNLILKFLEILKDREKVIEKIKQDLYLESEFNKQA